MKRQRKSPEQVLPEEMLADVLGRLAPRSLAVSRCVCKAWHDVIDAHKLLRADLLPNSLGGILVNFNMLQRTEFFSCPTARGRGGPAAVSGDLSYIKPHPNISVDDHCNGLLLLSESVANPATRQWEPLPPQPPLSPVREDIIYEVPYLMFDPAISPHYEVFLMPVVASWAELEQHSMVESEWPPSTLETSVFSSSTGCWEERSFVREGEPAGTMAAMRRACKMMVQCYSVYRHEALYMYCKNDFFCKISVANSKYHVFKPPVAQDSDESHEPYLGKSENGVYCAILDLKFRLRVWILDESCGQMEWVLKHENNLEHELMSQDLYKPHDIAWTLEDLNHYAHFDKDNDGEQHDEEPKLRNHTFITLLGFHPYKEIVFLNSSLSRGFAYDLNSSMVQDLGNMCPIHYHSIAGQHAYIQASFPYTPCWMENSLPTTI